MCANEALAGVEGADKGTRCSNAQTAEAEDREAGERAPSPGIPAILGQPAAPGTLRVWPEEWGHCEHRASPSLQGPQRLQCRSALSPPRHPRLILFLPPMALYLAWGVREGRDILLFQATSPHHNYSHIVCGIGLDRKERGSGLSSIPTPPVLTGNHSKEG